VVQSLSRVQPSPFPTGPQVGFDEKLMSQSFDWQSVSLPQLLPLGSGPQTPALEVEPPMQRPPTQSASTPHAPPVGTGAQRSVVVQRPPTQSASRLQREPAGSGPHMPPVMST
jgi:hypothetical protein